MYLKNFDFSIKNIKQAIRTDFYIFNLMAKDKRKLVIFYWKNYFYCCIEYLELPGDPKVPESDHESIKLLNILAAIPLSYLDAYVLQNPENEETLSSSFLKSSLD